MLLRTMLRTHEGKPSEEKNLFVTALDLIRCLKQIKYKRLLLMCAPIPGLTSNISTMVKGQFFAPPKGSRKKSRK